MKVPLVAKVLALNLVLLVLAYLVYQDVAGRNAYAGDLNFAPSTSYSIFTHALTLSGRGTVLTSPPTLDWFQLLSLIAAATDVYILWEHFKARKPPEKRSLTAAEPNPRPAQSPLD